MRIVVACVLLWALVLGAAGPGGAQERTDKVSSRQKVIEMTHMRPMSSSIGCWLYHVYRVAFKRLGYELDYLYYPAARASSLACAGEVDGELARTAQYGKSHPNLVRVEEPHLRTSFSAYSTVAVDGVADWASLANSDYTIGYVRGIEMLEWHFAFIPPHRVQTVRDAADGIRMLLRKRIDIFVGPESNLDAVLACKEFSGATVKKLVLDNHAGHAYLHVKHAELAERLSDVLRKMKEEGELSKADSLCGSSYMYNGSRPVVSRSP